MSANTQATDREMLVVAHELKNVEDVTFETATVASLDAVLRLLSNSGLPVADVEVHIDAFTLARSEGQLVGTVGLEMYGEIALLRSLFVAPTHRSKGIGAVLVQSVQSRVVTKGVRGLYLLTTGATAYFENLGFTSVPRDQVPQEIRSTAQFSSLCPSTAACMRKAIAAGKQQ
jgi:amino-acid N-acetyltransferase